MKIVVVINSLKSGGAQRVVSTLTHEWAKSHQVLLTLFDTSRPAFDHGGRLVDLRTPPQRGAIRKLRNLILRSIRLAGVLRGERPDRIVSFMESANFPTLMAAALTGLMDRVCVSVHCNPATISGPKRILISIVYRLAEGIVAPSNGVRKELQKMGLPARKLSVIPNPIAIRSDTTTSARPDSPLRYILGVGRLERVKGFDRLLKAFSLIDRSGIDLVILGDGTQRSALLEISQELGIAPYVHLLGVVADVDAWYRHATCFVLTSHNEGFANVVAEAMASGCPILSFDCEHGPAEILDGGRNGILVAQDDITGLAVAIQRLVADQALRRRLSNAGQHRAMAYSVGKVAPRWLYPRR